MSYLNIVTVKCAEKALERFRNAIEEHRADIGGVPRHSCLKDRYGDFYINFHWECWDVSTMPIAKEFKKIMDELDREMDETGDSGLCYGFIRIGEDTGDIEERCNG